MSAHGPARRRPMSRVLFRASATTAAVLAAAQPVLAGAFMSGRYPMLAVHSATGSALAISLAVMTASSALTWRGGHCPGWLAGLSAAALVSCAAQIGLGYARILTLHVPLGVFLVGLVVAIGVLSWRTLGGVADTVPPRGVEAMKS